MTHELVIVGDEEYLYPEAGDPTPPPIAKVILLTVGGVCVTGEWTGSRDYIGYGRLPRRNADKEKLVVEAREKCDQVIPGIAPGHHSRG